MRPFEELRYPLSMLKVVVLPAPFGPSNPKHSLYPMAILSDFTASFGGCPLFPGKVFHKLVILMAEFSLLKVLLVTRSCSLMTSISLMSGCRAFMESSTVNNLFLLTHRPNTDVS